ncbi:MAG: T9SS type A sorting domain-containing protein [Bacteroidetes bacterium]|nr:T9SS type A sorting domain-containing protein [Bacteroidota bacterium]
MSCSNVKKLIYSFILLVLPWNFISAQNFFGQEDSVIDIPCNPTSFYGVSANTVRELQITGQNIVDLGIITTAPFPSILAMAYANDFMNGSTNRTFYSSVVAPAAIIKYTGTSWSTIATDSLIYANAGGYGDYLYFQHISPVGQVNDQCISRLLPNGVLQKIFTDTSLTFTVADLEVDSAGNVYFLRGTFVSNTTELTVIDSSGNVINSYTADSTFSTLSFLYGMFFMNNQLYLAHGIIPPVIRPLIITGTTVSLGASILLPTITSYKDFDNCYQQPIVFSGTASLENDDPSISCYPNPFTHETTITANTSFDIDNVSVFSVHGQLADFDIGIKNLLSKFQIKQSLPGIYFVRIVLENKTISYTKVVVSNGY